MITKHSFTRLLMLSLLLCLGALKPPEGFAAVSTVYQVQRGGTTYTCGGPIAGKYVPGTLNKAGKFTPSSTAIKKLQMQTKAAKAARKTRLQRSLARMKGYLKRGLGVCRSGPPAQPTPTPVPLPTPAAPGCFDADGNASGCFGIPSGTSGNISRGSNLFSSLCAQCHPGMGGKTYGKISSALGIPAMASAKAQLNQQGIADIAAYLNRNSR